MPRTRIGMLTPSSNTALEPATYRLLAQIPEITAHFARFPVTEIALSPGALSQFDQAPILAAAELLSHAKVDVIAWNGTSAAWLGFDRDEALVRAIGGKDRNSRHYGDPGAQHAAASDEGGASCARDALHR